MPTVTTSRPIVHLEPEPPESGGWIRRMRPYLTAHKRNLGLSVGSAMFGMGLAAFQPVITKHIIDQTILAPDGDRDSITPWLIILCATGFARFVFGYGRRYFGGRVSLDVQYDLRNTIFDHLQRLDFARHDELETGQLVSRASSDVDDGPGAPVDDPDHARQPAAVPPVRRPDVHAVGAADARGPAGDPVDPVDGHPHAGRRVPEPRGTPSSGPPRSPASSTRP